MLDYVSRIVPKPVKRVLRRPFDYLTRGMQHRIQSLEGQVAELQARLFELAPDLIQPSADVLAGVTELLAQHGLALDRVNLNISKHDPMYQAIAGASADRE